MLKRLLTTAWRLYAHSSGVFLVVLLATYGIVATFDEHGRVVTVTAAQLLTPTVAYMGVVKYLISYDRHMSCPGTRTISFARDAAAETIALSAPSPGLAVGEVVDRAFAFSLPASVYPGRWRVRVTLESRCPTHRQRDLVMAFNILVISDDK